MTLVAVLIVVQFALTLLVPGLMAVAYDNLPGLAGMVLFLHAVSVAVLEHILYTQDTEIYPYYLVVATSVTGACVFYKLHQMKKVTLVWRWLGTSLYVAKLALALTTVDYSVVYTFFLLLSVTVLYVMPTPKTASAQGNLNSMVTGIIIVTGCMIFLTRNTILAKVIFLFTQQQLSPMATFASFLVAWGLSITPLSFRFFAHKPLVRAANFALIVCGSLLYLVSADVTPTSRAQVHSQGTAWANWFLLAGLVPLVFVMTSLINLNRVKKLRLIMPVIIGTFLGLYISGRFIPLPPPRTAYSTSTPLVVIVQHLLHGMVLACAGVFLSVTQWPSSSSSQSLWVYTTFVSLFPVLYAMANQVFIFAPILVRTESVMVSRVVLVGLYAAINFLISLFLKFKVSNVKFAPSERKPRAEAPSRRVHTQPTDHNAVIGNFATISTFLFSIYLQIGYLGGSEIAILVLAPVLLLLNRDSRLLKHLNDTNRYFPIVFTISSVLIAYSCKRLILPTSIPVYASVWLWTIKNAVLLLLTLPSHYLFNNYLWDAAHASKNSLLWIISTGLNVLPLLFADLQGVQCLAVLSGIGWAMQYFDAIARRKKSQGQVL